MGLFTYIEKLITEHGSAKILRAHLSLAETRSTQLETTSKELQSQLTVCQEKLEVVTLERDQVRQELQRLGDMHEEEVRIHQGIEFRRGKRTGNHWLPFCPKCHIPVFVVKDDKPYCPDVNCKWVASISSDEIPGIIKEL